MSTGLKQQQQQQQQNKQKQIWSLNLNLLKPSIHGPCFSLNTLNQKINLCVNYIMAALTLSNYI